MISELQKVADSRGSVDQELTAISDKWLDRVGVSKEAIDTELTKYIQGQRQTIVFSLRSICAWRTIIIWADSMTGYSETQKEHPSALSSGMPEGHEVELAKNIKKVRKVKSVRKVALVRPINKIGVSHQFLDVFLISGANQL